MSNTVSGFNPNTAPKPALLTYVPGLTDQSATQVVEKRLESQFRHARDFMTTADVVVANEAFFFSISPGNCTIVASQAGRSRIESITASGLTAARS